MSVPEGGAPPGRSILAFVFLSPHEARLRAGWRLLLQTLLMLLVFVPISLLLAVAGFLVPMQELGNLVLIASQVAVFVGFGLSIFVARRWLDRRSFGSLGVRLTRRALPDVLAGVVISFFMMGLIYIIELAAGWLRFEHFAWNVEPIGGALAGALSFLVFFTFVGWNEELLFRGYQLQTIASGTNLSWGVVLSSLIFGLAHLSNPNAGAVWQVASGILLAGLFLSFAYVRTRDLWLAIGLHIGWNFFEGVVFGFPVSGLEIYRLLRVTVAGPELWTGGAFGPEAGLVVLPGLVLGTLLIYVYTARRAVSAETG